MLAQHIQMPQISLSIKQIDMEIKTAIPIGDRVIIEPIKPQQKEGLIMPDKDRAQMATIYSVPQDFNAEIWSVMNSIDAAIEKLTDETIIQGLLKSKITLLEKMSDKNYKVGDTVLYNKAFGTELHIDGKDLLLIRALDMFCKV